MGIILAILSGVGTLAVVALIMFANGMSSAPSANGISPLPALIVGGLITAAFAYTHWHPLSW